MKDDHHSSFSNPIAPAGHVVEDKEDAKPLSNEDFRKLVMSTRGAGAGGSKEKVLGMGHSVRGVRVSGSVPSTPGTSASAPSSGLSREDKVAAEKRKKKKTEYLKQRKVELEKEAELASKYRDRAKERRAVQDQDEETAAANEKATQNYHAVNPNATDGEADRRRNQIIQESKFLGGDMEHTHLVKGLDYALLQKVRAEIVNKENDSLDEKLENLNNSDDMRDSEVSKIEVRSAMAKNIHRVLFQELPEKNELFRPGRMAYLVELEEEFADSDVPTTMVRSKIDCPSVSEISTTSSTNDLVINKLTQILAYLRQGGRGGKKWKKKWATMSKEEKVIDPASELGIFGNSEDGRVLSSGAGTSIQGGAKAGSGAGDGRRFDKRSDDSSLADSGRREERVISRGDRRDDRPEKKGDASRKRETRVRFAHDEKDEDYHQSKKEERPTKSAIEMIKDINTKFGHLSDSATKAKSAKIAKKQGSDCYSECYPGMDCDDVVDSDDEADYTKMDQGNKKGPVGRWDFETTEEYSDYMSSKEAMPKAAFQFGVKMADGRKTRRLKPQSERQKLEREWKQISQLLEKRRQPQSDGAKRSKY